MGWGEGGEVRLYKAVADSAFLHSAWKRVGCWLLLPGLYVCLDLTSFMAFHLRRCGVKGFAAGVRHMPPRGDA